MLSTFNSQNISMGKFLIDNDDKKLDNYSKSTVST